MGIQGEAWEKAGLLKEDLGRMGESGQGLLDSASPALSLRTSVTHGVLSPFDPLYWGERSFLLAEKRQDGP